METTMYVVNYDIMKGVFVVHSTEYKELKAYHKDPITALKKLIEKIYKKETVNK